MRRSTRCVLTCVAVRAASQGVPVARGGFVVSMTVAVDGGVGGTKRYLTEAVNGAAYDGWDTSCSGPGYYRLVLPSPPFA